MAKQLESLTIRPGGKGGGHSVEARFKPGVGARMGGKTSGLFMSPVAPESMNFGDGDHAKLMSHIGKILGIAAALRPSASMKTGQNISPRVQGMPKGPGSGDEED